MKEITYIGNGRNRAVYRRGNYVIKVPLNDYGIGDNYYEAETYRRSLREDLGIKCARCRLFGILLVMEFACYTGPLSDETGYIISPPGWAVWVDCNQVGYNRRGEIVAYDYGLH